MGYVPLFDHLTTGTLCGKWPDIGLWPIVLSMADKHGRIDVTPAYIAVVTGLTAEDVEACMARFCEPDPNSRTLQNEGRRLELIDPARAWGWRVINHGAYREKARLLAKDTERTNSGVDAERKRLARQRPPVSPEIPLSDADADADAKRIPVDTSEQTDTSVAPSSQGEAEREPVVTPMFAKPKRAKSAPRGTRLPETFDFTEARAAVAKAEGLPNPEREFYRFTDYWRGVAGERGRKIDWEGTWRNWCRKAADDFQQKRGAQHVTRFEASQAKLREAERNATR